MTINLYNNFTIKSDYEIYEIGFLNSVFLVNIF